MNTLNALNAKPYVKGINPAPGNKYTVITFRKEGQQAVCYEYPALSASAIVDSTELETVLQAATLLFEAQRDELAKRAYASNCPLNITDLSLENIAKAVITAATASRTRSSVNGEQVRAWYNDCLAPQFSKQLLSKGLTEQQVAATVEGLAKMYIALCSARVKISELERTKLLAKVMECTPQPAHLAAHEFLMARLSNVALAQQVDPLEFI